MDTVEELARKAARLKPEERAQLVEAILATLDPPDPEVESRWVAESEARYAAYKRGELGARGWEEVRGEYEAVWGERTVG